MKPDAFDRLALGVRRFEIGLLSLVFLAVLGIGLAQIVLRNFGGGSLPWADPAMRAGVLWIAMLAGVLAADTGKHIRIDVLRLWLPDGLRPWVIRIMRLSAALVCITLTAASASLIQLEYSLNDLAFLGVPRWAVLMIIPLGFGLMSWRFLRRALLPGSSLDEERDR
ncbi:MAG: TRAP transporter small permease [Wenzhouxiangellaceae bacterium]|nr:TRAP transporter small permease [Wenzhouxiangellaceae bacterium]